MAFSRFDLLLPRMIKDEEKPAKEGRTSGAAASEDSSLIR